MGIASNKTPEQGSDHRTFIFGDEFVLDIDRGALIKDGADVPLRPKCFKVLCYLVEHHGRLVTKGELLGAVWADVVVTGDSLTQCLIQIRKALGDHSREMIRTVPRRGFLFDIPVAVHQPGQNFIDPATTHSSVSDRRPSRWSVGAAVVLAMAITTTWWNAQRQEHEHLAPDYNRTTALPASIAVLPFVDMSPEKDQQYFADGMSEEVLNLLAQTPELIVIARTSSFSFKHRNTDIETIARKLNVANVLEGSVRKNGDQVRITAQLVKTSNSAHLWSQTYDRTLDDIFAVQTEIASAVAEVLKFKLLGEAHAADSRNDPPLIPDAKAWEHYLKGKFFYSRRGIGDNELAIRHYRKALDSDPDLADAWVGLAGSINLQSYHQDIPREQGQVLIKAALDKALALEPNHAEAHSRMARYYSCAGEPDRGQRHLDLALKYGQNSPLVQSIVAGNAFGTGSYAEAINLQRRAVALDPLGFVNRGNLAGYLYSAGRFEEARLEYHNALELNPEMLGEINWSLALVHILLEQFEEAQLLVQQIPDGLAKDQVQAMIHHTLQGPDEPNAALARLLADPSIEAAVYLVDFYSFQDKFDESFRWLSLATVRILEQESLYSKDEYLSQMWNSPFLVPLRDEPRWASWEAGIEKGSLENQLQQGQAN